MCKFTEIRVRRIENNIISDLARLAENLDTLKRFYECSAIQPKQAYRRAKCIANRFDILLKRLQNALIAADRFEIVNNSTNPEKYYISHKDYTSVYRSIIVGLQFFGL